MFRSRPLLLAAGLFAVGIAFHAGLPQWPMRWFFLAGAFAMAAVLTPRWIGDICLSVGMLLSGALAGQLASFHYRADHIGHFTSDEPQLVWVEMRIDDPPRILSDAFSSRPLPPRQAAQASALAVQTRAGWRPASGTVLLHLSQPVDNLAIGQRIRAAGMLSRPLPAMNPGQFDWSDYYRRQRILATLHVAHASSVRILSSPGPGVLDRLQSRVRQALAVGFTPQQSLDHALLAALVLGDRDTQLRDVQDQFVRTGTSHHLAISGMHIAVLGGFVYGVCRLLLLAPRLAAWIGMIFVILYGSVALPSPPVVRSVLLCLAFALGMVSRRSVDGVQLLSLSVLLMLVYHPLDLYDAGFQLSFGTVLGLMIFSRPVMQWLAARRDRDIVIAEQFQTPTPRQRLVRVGRKWLVDGLAAGLIAWTVSAPLIAFHFNQLNPWAILAGMLLAIPVAMSLIAGMIKIILGLLWPGLGVLTAPLVALPVQLMRLGVGWLEKLPGSDMPLPRPTIVAIVVFYLLLLLPLIPRPRLRRFWRLAPAIAPAVIIIPLCWSIARPQRDTRLTLLSVSAGQCAVLELPTGHAIILDAGSSSPDAARSTLLPYLKHRGIRGIDAIFISHANQDHFNCLQALIPRQRIGAVHLSPQFASHADETPAAAGLLRSMSAATIPVKTISAESSIVLDDRVRIDVLWPPADQELDVNNASLVLRLTCNGRSVLLPGDILDAAMSQIAADAERCRADVLVAPHHGSCVPATRRLLESVQPELIVASNGQKLSGKQREFDNLAGRTVHRTSACGALTLRITPEGAIALEPFRTPKR